MIVDFSAYIGHWPFRPLRHNTASGLLKLMDRHGIDMAVVSNLSSIFYKNAHAGNEELADQLRRHRDRLIPFGVINPTYADWRRDLDVCVEEFGVSGLRLYPDYHNYSLDSAPCAELVNAATDRGLVLCVPIRVTDSRQSSWLFPVPEVPLSAAASLAQRFPQARFVFLNGLRYSSCPLGQSNSGLPANYHIGISRLSAVMQDEMSSLIGALGRGRLLFASGMPMKGPGPALTKMDALRATSAVKERILWRNAKALLGGAFPSS